MLKKHVKIGEVYTAKVSNKLVPVRIDSENRLGGWNATNVTTKKAVRIKSAHRLRSDYNALCAAAADKTAAKAKAIDAAAKTRHRLPEKKPFAELPSERLGVPPTTPDVDVKVKAAAGPAPGACPNCGSTEFDEDGDCAKCHEPKIAVKEEKAKKPQTKKAVDPANHKRMSALDAAAKVLSDTGLPMSAHDIIEAASAAGYWKSPGGKTPAATVYSAMLREIKTKGDESRFRQTETRGKFIHN